MKFVFILLLMCSASFAANRIAPPVESIDPDELLSALHANEDFRTHAPTIRRGLVGSQLTYRVESAQWFIQHGTIEDVPYLIDALSDESMHVGANYPLAGMATTRYWANVALIVICKTSYDYQWEASKEKREYSISQWEQHWERIKLNGCVSDSGVNHPSQYNGKELLSVASDIGGDVVIDDTFLASDGKMGLRAPIPCLVRKMGLNPESTTVRAYWLQIGDYYYTTYSLKTEEKWFIFDVVKWHKDVQF